MPQITQLDTSKPCLKHSLKKMKNACGQVESMTYPMDEDMIY